MSLNEQKVLIFQSFSVWLVMCMYVACWRNISLSQSHEAKSMLSSSIFFVLHFAISSLIQLEGILVLCYDKGVSEFLKKDRNDYIKSL